jgi:hypothetical protein
MLLLFNNRIQVPAEITIQVLEYLPRADLKSARLVSHGLSTIACPMLFKSITASAQRSDMYRFLNIIRDQRLCKMVERFIWDDLPFRNHGSKPSQTTTVFYPPPQVLATYFGKPVDEGKHSGDSNVSNSEEALWEQQQRDLTFRLKLLLEHPDCNIAGPDVCSAALVEGFKSMSRLRTIISRNTRDPGSTIDAIVDPPVSSDGQHLLPLSDAAMRLLEFPGNDVPSVDAQDNGGFPCVLKALAISGAPIENLVTEPVPGLVKVGFRFRTPLTVFPKDFEHTFAQAFRSLRRISICLDEPNQNCAMGFSRCLQAAEQLEHLELSITHNSMSFIIHENKVLPSLACFTKLHTLVLESVSFSAEAITSFIVRHGQSLNSVALWDCPLCEPDRWKDVVQALAEAEDLYLETFILKSPLDVEINEHLMHGEVTARVKSEDILRFINKGGENPFEYRRWLRGDSLDDTLSHASDYSDISGWMGRRVPTDEFGDIMERDPDGPEYDSDYDFDAEPGSESESEIEIEPDFAEGRAARRKGAEERFYNEMWSRFPA